MIGTNDPVYASDSFWEIIHVYWEMEGDSISTVFDSPHLPRTLWISWTTFPRQILLCAGGGKKRGIVAVADFVSYH